MRVERDGGRSIVRVLGELDIATAPQLAEALVEAAGGGAAVVVDLTATTFLDSSGLRTMVMAARDAERFVLVCPPENSTVLRVITFAGFQHAVPLVATVDEADASG